MPPLVPQKLTLHLYTHEDSAQRKHNQYQFSAYKWLIKLLLNLLKRSLSCSLLELLAGTIIKKYEIYRG